MKRGPLAGTALMASLVLFAGLLASAQQARPDSVFPPRAVPLYLTDQRGSVDPHSDVLLLQEEPPAAQGSQNFIAPGVTVLTLVNQPSVADWFTDDTWAEDMEVAASATAVLYFSANAQALTVFEVRLVAVHPDGASETLAYDSQQFVTALSPSPVTFFLNPQGLILRQNSHLQLQIYAQTGNVAVVLSYGGQTPSGISDLRVRWLDSDGDGVADSVERREGSNPVDAADYLRQWRDSDDDGIVDSMEARLGTDPTLPDTDGDGFGDGVELHAGSDPLNPASGPHDANSNGLPDSFETRYFNNTTINNDGRPVDPRADPDDDGCDNLCEAAHGTNPNDRDTDDDGIGDGDEMVAGTDPNGRNGSRDSDDDGLPDSFEDAIGTDPDDPDTDGDGFLDGVEVYAGTNPRDPASAPQDEDKDGLPDTFEIQFFNTTSNVFPTGDPDRDGCDNLCETAHGTDPTNPDTDGDGTPDGHEIDVDSDPKDQDVVPQARPDRAEIQSGAGLFALASILSLFGIARWKP